MLKSGNPRPYKPTIGVSVRRGQTDRDEHHVRQILEEPVVHQPTEQRVLFDHQNELHVDEQVLEVTQILGDGDRGGVEVEDLPVAIDQLHSAHHAAFAAAHLQ